MLALMAFVALVTADRGTVDVIPVKTGFLDLKNESLAGVCAGNNGTCIFLTLQSEEDAQPGSRIVTVDLTTGEKRELWNGTASPRATACDDNGQKLMYINHEGGLFLHDMLRRDTTRIVTKSAPLALQYCRGRWFVLNRSGAIQVMDAGPGTNKEFEDTE